MPATGQTTPGIEQDVTGDAPEDAALIGEIAIPDGLVEAFGTINDTGSSHVSARVDTAVDANPGAIDQSVDADSGDAQAIISLDGAVSISAVAVAENEGGSASADTDINFAVRQFAVSDDQASTLLTIGGPDANLAILSSATATGSTNANADARVDRGVVQQADGSTASLAINNAGTITAATEAAATGVTGANAYSYLYRSIYQETEDQPVSLLSIDNAAGAVIATTSSAVAATETGTAHAQSYNQLTIHQEVDGNYYSDDGDVAEVSLTNAGDISAVSTADATTESGRAEAYAYHDLTVNQEVEYVEAASTFLSNAEGASITGEAWGNSATGLGDAYAQAQSYHSVLQNNYDYYYYDYSNDEDDTGSNEVINAGAISTTAQAVATTDSGRADADSYGYHALGQYSHYNENNLNTLTNLASGVIRSSGTSAATSEDGRADAYSYTGDIVYQYGYGQYYYYDDDNLSATVSNAINNAGSISGTNIASADGSSADSYSYGNAIVRQYGSYAENISNIISNAAGGSISYSGSATSNASDGDAEAEGDLYRLTDQYAYNYNYYTQDNGELASLVLENSGTLSGSVVAEANSQSGDADAESDLDQGIQQHSYGSTRVHDLSIANMATGSISLSAASVANAVNGSADAETDLDGGIYQYAYTDYYYTSVATEATLALSNAAGGSISLMADAEATAVNGQAAADSEVDGGIYQYANTDLSSLSISNAGAISISSNSSAFASIVEEEEENGSGEEVEEAASLLTMGPTASAYASSGIVPGIRQLAYGSSATLANTGSISISSQANAQAHDEASVYSYAEGVAQHASGQDASVSMTNGVGGNVNVAAMADASGLYAYSETGAIGLSQSLQGGFGPSMIDMAEASIAQGNGLSGGNSATFRNAGTFAVSASANSDGEEYGAAGAAALGYEVSGQPLVVDVANTGTLNVSSHATSTGWAVAEALGMSVGSLSYFNSHGGSLGTMEMEEEPQFWGLSGTISNSGTLTVTARAEGGDAGSGPGMTTMDAVMEEPTAFAGGILVQSNDLDLAIVNSGTIRVSAISNGAPVEAGGIGVFGGGGFVPVSVMVDNGGEEETPRVAGLVIANNGGTIIARQSTDGGATWQHGTAISVEDAPNVPANPGHLCRRAGSADRASVCRASAEPAEQFAAAQHDHFRPDGLCDRSCRL
jgi:trimeric autotransporter adhesin